MELSQLGIGDRLVWWYTHVYQLCSVWFEINFRPSHYLSPFMTRRRPEDDGGRMLTMILYTAEKKCMHAYTYPPIFSHTVSEWKLHKFISNKSVLQYDCHGYCAGICGTTVQNLSHTQTHTDIHTRITNLKSISRLFISLIHHTETCVSLV